MLEVTGLCKSYKGNKVLEEIFLTVPPGECVGIVGSNGCGKTTLLSILAGAIRADRGSILFHGREAIGNSKVFYEEAAYVPQENPLIEELSVRDNLSLWYRGSRMRMEEDLKTGAAAMLGIREMQKKTVSSLSGGMKKRLSIACALSNHASVLILDEPGAALDLECKAAIREYLEKYRKNGGTILLTSHELPELSMCTMMYVLKGGKLLPVETKLGERELIEMFQRT